MGNKPTVKELELKNLMLIFGIVLIMAVVFLIGLNWSDTQKQTEQEQVMNFLDGIASLDYFCIGQSQYSLFEGTYTDHWCINENMTLNAVRKRYETAKNMPYGENVIFGVYKQMCGGLT